MALSGDQIKKDPKLSAASSPGSAVSAEEKQLLYQNLKTLRPKRYIGNRTAIFILIVAVFGFLAAVLAIRLFPM